MSTPNDDDEDTPNMTGMKIASKDRRTQSAVKFGTNQAAEFDLEQPITEMTPMPATVVQEIFPTDKVETEKDVNEYVESRETARNVAMLAEWDDDFDSIVSQEDGSNGSSCGDGGSRRMSSGGPPKRGRKRTPFKHGRRRPQKNRRESHIFSRERRSLLEESDNDEDDSNSGLPFSVTIDPNEYTSPSSSSGASDNPDKSLSKVDTPRTAGADRDSLESRASTCVSPSSLKANAITDTVLDTVGRETPNSARTSSSNLLRAVHASGALLPSNSPRSGGLRPNQLKYSPRNSGERLDSSPDDSDESLGSDIMSLFNLHNIDDDESTLVQRQLSILSKHPSQMLHLSICDLIQSIHASRKDSVQFINDHLLKNATGATVLSLVTDDNAKSLFSGNSAWLQSAFFKYNGQGEATTSAIHNSFESILLKEVMATCEHQSSLGSCGKSFTSTTDGDCRTIADTIKQLYRIASIEWSSRETDAARRALCSLQEVAMSQKSEATRLRKFVNSRCSNILEASNTIIQLLSKSNASVLPSAKRKLSTRKRKAVSLIQTETDNIQYLEQELTVAVDRLGQAKSAKKILCANLEVERSRPISLLSEEIRTFISPAPTTQNASDFTFSLLDGSAEIAMKIEPDEKGPNSVELGCFIKDGGVSIKLLQAVLLGNLEKIDGTCGPFPLRDSLASVLLQNQSRSELITDATHLFFRIDSLLKSVKKLEATSFCTVNAEDNGDISLSVAFQKDGALVQFVFLFDNLLGEDWAVAILPSDVKVSIMSNEKDHSAQSDLLCREARSILVKAKPNDPTLLRRILEVSTQM